MLCEQSFVTHAFLRAVPADPLSPPAMWQAHLPTFRDLVRFRVPSIWCRFNGLILTLQAPVFAAHAVALLNRDAARISTLVGRKIVLHGLPFGRTFHFLRSGFLRFAIARTCCLQFSFGHFTVGRLLRNARVLSSSPAQARAAAHRVMPYASRRQHAGVAELECAAYPTLLSRVVQRASSFLRSHGYDRKMDAIVPLLQANQPRISDPGMFFVFIIR
ncbi:hypothetical protein EVG20_g3245 [Dentipellis fragilis]|uniref:Uncharacterized protein n=1 Tax=Dentipellis fragilis TaxID=205917 RepID=A0A4Y9Z731_9AGAM|nr:hypothetical protein EVG20_g3245 [Dentipellis fragilis]